MFGGGFFGAGGPFGGGGFEGMGGGGGPPRSDNTRYYKVLGVDKGASDAEIKKAHRKAALKHHPDKGGDPDTFKNINEAYDVLRDPEKRQIYDQYGEDAIKEGMGSAGPSMGGMADIFEMFGGGGGRGGRGGNQGPRRGENVVHRLKVSLEELYRGATRKLSLQRNVKCQPCSGVGTKSGRRYPCEACGGSGIQVSMRPLGPGMMQQIQHACSACRQTGVAVPPSDKCATCSGRGLVPEKKVFEVHVEPGHRHGSKIVLRGEAGCSDPSVLPGDVIFVLEQKPHALFKRIGTDLVMDKHVSLAEALTGCSFDVTTLEEGRSIRVRHSAGAAVIKPDTWMRVADEGMPTHGRPYEKGNLYIHYTVDFPDRLEAEQVSGLRKIFGVKEDETAAAGAGGAGAGAGAGAAAAAAASTSGGGGGAASTSEAPTEMDADGTTSVHADRDGVDVVIPSSVADIESELQARRAAAKQGEAEAYASSDDEDGGGGRRGVQCAQQ